MAKAGRDLEELVETLESLLAGTGVELRSPEFIQGKNSKTLREIDVTLRSRIGSTPVLVMMECRKRGRIQDVQWIDEIAGKKDDVGADKAVAVARKGFTAAARNAAEFRGIELRTLGDVDAASLSSWLNTDTLTVKTRYSAPRDVKIFASASAAPDLMSAAADVLGHPDVTNEAILKVMSEGRMISIAELLRDCPKPDSILNLEPGEVKINAVSLHRPDPASWLAVVTPAGDLDLDSIRIEGEFWVEHREVPASRYEYRSADGLLADGALAEFEQNGSTVKVGLHSVPDGRLVMSIEHPDGAGSPWEAGIDYVLLELEKDSE